MQNVDYKHFDRFHLFIDNLNENTKDDKERSEMIRLKIETIKYEIKHLKESEIK